MLKICDVCRERRAFESGMAMEQDSSMFDVTANVTGFEENSTYLVCESLTYKTHDYCTRGCASV